MIGMKNHSQITFQGKKILLTKPELRQLIEDGKKCCCGESDCLPCAAFFFCKTQDCGKSVCKHCGKELASIRRS
jgi:hypothetical protein